MKRVLIANRGEIAVRIIRALRDLEIESVALYSDADRESLHRHLADYAVRLPGETSQATYLNVPLILEAIKVSGADGVHPGYGFLSENAAFAEQVFALGVEFIGPPPKAMLTMGDKIEAKKAMAAAGVPIVPGSIGALKSFSELKSLVGDIGFPVILKAAGGGGGRGMRKVTQASELEASFKACEREAKEYFGSEAVFCERYIQGGRHIEFQVLFDKHGNGVHLFERDCSIQRRHQKLLEEAPSTFLDTNQRTKLGEIAVKAGQIVGYVGVGTVEFICASPEQCYFMEMNTRIQVEHPVTEMITGIDLIAAQINVARGEKLPFIQADLKVNGWAIETRINAEEPSLDFMASPGLVEHLLFPQGPFVRVDSHLYQGYTIPRFYDSMVAKIITWGKNRSEALRRMQRALSEMQIEGIPTTAKFHEAVLADPDFVAGKFDTMFIDQKGESLKAAMAGNPKLVNAHTETLALLTAALANQQVSRKPLLDSHKQQRWLRKTRSEIESY